MPTTPDLPATADRPIGVYDSGVGGLSVLRAIRARLPHEHLLYVADSAHVPYGEKSRHAVTARALAIADYYVERGAKAIAVPCNTATAAAIGALRARHPGLPIVGIEPAVKPAARLTRSGVIGVLATTGTLNSPRFRDLVQREAPECRIVLRPCPEWVIAVERGEVAGPAARAVVEPAVREVLAQGADVLVLGCTHFPFLAEAIHQAAGPGVTVLETGEAVARQLHRQLEAHEALRCAERRGECEFVTSGDPAALAAAVAALLGETVAAATLPARYR